MSLDYDFRAIKGDWHKQPENAGKVESIIFATMAVDMGQITEKNTLEFWNRYRVWLVHVNLMDFNPPYWSYHDLCEMIGLRTNVITKTRFQWDNRMRKQYGRD